MKEIGVKDFKVDVVKYELPTAYAQLAPKNLFPATCSVVLTNCNNAIANGIRRTIMCELPVKALSCEYEDIDTDDPFIVPEMVQARLRSIPLDQTIPIGTVYSVSAKSSVVPLDVHTSTFKPASRYFNNMTLLTLQPLRYLNIRNIRVSTEIGIREGYGMHAVAFNATSIALDIAQMNPYEGTGVSSHVADPRMWKLSFNTNGTMEPAAIIKYACDNIIERLKAIPIDEITEHDSQYALSLPGESHTIGNLIVRTTLDIYPDIPAITCVVGSVDRVATIKIRYGDDINIMLKTVIDDLVKKFTIIKSSL
jgi:DNA-directed RNA polymerase subunit L